MLLKRHGDFYARFQVHHVIREYKLRATNRQAALVEHDRFKEEIRLARLSEKIVDQQFAAAENILAKKLNQAKKGGAVASIGTVPLPKRLTDYCERYGISDKEAGKMLGVSRQTLINWREGRPISKTNIQRVLAFISVPPVSVQSHATADALSAYIIASLAGFTAAEKGEVVATIERIKEKRANASDKKTKEEIAAMTEEK